MLIFAACQKDNPQSLNRDTNEQPANVIQSDPGSVSISCTWVIDNFHRPKKDCLQGFWVCGHFEGCEIVVAEPTTYSSGSGTIYTNILGDNQMEIIFLKNLTELGVATEDQNTFFAESGEEIMITGSDAAKVGYDGIVIEAGNYQVMENANGLKYVIVNYHRR